MIEVFKILFAFAAQWLDSHRKIQQAKQEQNHATVEASTRLISDQELNNQAWQIQALKGADKFLERISFVILFWPFVLCPFNPGIVKAYFDALAQMPSWYIQMCAGVLATIWGLLSLKDVVPYMVHSIRNAANGTRGEKLPVPFKDEG